MAEGYHAENITTMEMLTRKSPHGRKLAVVGGGPSVREHLNELREWGGDIWAINHTGTFLKKEGINSTFVTVDSGHPSEFITDGVNNAIMATCCHPKLKERFKSCLGFPLIEQDKDGITGGTTTATRMPALALMLGYVNISFFGCESSFNLSDGDHVDRNENRPNPLLVRANGKEYATYLDLVLQAENLAMFMSRVPDMFIDRSGGLVSAMSADPEGWEVVAVSKDLRDNIESVSGKCGMYENPYTPEEYRIDNARV